MRRIKLVALIIAALVTQLALAQRATTDAQSASFPAVDTDDFALPRFRLLQMQPIQEALKLTGDQKRRQPTVVEDFFKKLRARRSAIPAQDFVAARDELGQALLGELEPAQRERFDQIELQLQGPAAFASPELPKRLKLSDEQTDAVRAIAEEADKEIQQAARVPLPWKSGDASITEQAIRDLVASEKFQAAKKKARRAVFDDRAAALEKIEKKLTADQSAAYRKSLGEPLDVENFFQPSLPQDFEAQRDLQQVAWELGLAGGQRADPNFDTKVAHPAYASDHPQVLFDEAHNNFHTTDGRYKVFVELITSDGYRVTPNREPFTPALLAKYQVLVSANAMAQREGEGDTDAAKSAFTEDECKAVADWVKAGGSLLLITDHEPFGSASNLLAKQFGVDMSNRVVGDPTSDSERGLLFARDQGRLGDHAITNGRDATERVNRVLTFTGQSLKGPPESVAILKLGDTAVENDGEKQVSAAGRSQGLALRHGKGRVVVMGEAAELTAQIFGFPPMQFGMNAPNCDNRQMVLNILHWLTGLTN